MLLQQCAGQGQCVAPHWQSSAAANGVGHELCCAAWALEAAKGGVREGTARLPLAVALLVVSCHEDRSATISIALALSHIRQPWIITGR
jgi:hypothetical protein